MSTQTDAFEETVKPVFDNIASHRQWIVGGIIALVLVSAGVGVGSWYSKRNQEQASQLWYTAQKTLEKDQAAWVKSVLGEAPQVGSEKDSQAGVARQERMAQEAALQFKKADVDTVFKNAIPELKTVISRFPSSIAAFEARMTLGRLYFLHGTPERALDYFKEAQDKAPGQSETTLAKYALGYVYESQGKFTEAATEYERALALSQPMLLNFKGELLLAVARAHEGAKDWTKARSAYDRILAESPNTAAAKSAEAYRALLPAAAAQPQGK